MTASAPQQIAPTQMQATMQKVPLDHDLVACGGRGFGKSFGGELVVARDSTVLEDPQARGHIGSRFNSFKNPT